MELSIPFRRIFTHFFALVVLALPLAVHAAEPDVMHLHLDDGFLGHPVKLDLAGGKVRVAWNSGGLTKDGDVDLQYSGGVLTVNPSSPDMFLPGALAISLPALSSTSTFNQAAIETLNASSTWNVLPSTVSKGFVMAHASPGSFQVTIAPRGMRTGSASWYVYKHCKCAASPDFPKGTKLLVRRADDPSRSVIVKVNDYGPDRSLFPNRVIDLDKVAFKAIANPRGGLIDVTVEPLAPGDPRLSSKTSSS